MERDQERNYYLDLGIEKDATQAQIAQAYRILALKNHPKLSKGNANTAYFNLCRISEAYEVLSDRKKRDFYDIHGETKLKDGFFLDNQLKGGYTFKGNPGEIFESFFGTENPFAQIYDYQGKTPIGSVLGYQFDAESYLGVDLPSDLHVEVPCTLSELYNGCKKEISYKRIVLKEDGLTTKEISESKTIEIKQGYQHQYPIVFKEMGNQQAGVKSSDLVFDIKQLKDKRFKRKGNDLIYTANINLLQALNSEPVEIVTLDGRKIFTPIDEIIGPQTVKIVEGEGMPIYNPQEFKVEHFNQPLQRGNLVINFNIKFPLYIEEEKKSELLEILESCYPLNDEQE